LGDRFGLLLLQRVLDGFAELVVGVRRPGHGVQLPEDIQLSFVSPSVNPMHKKENRGCQGCQVVGTGALLRLPPAFRVAGSKELSELFC
jgi:hypothetical protein